MFNAKPICADRAEHRRESFVEINNTDRNLEPSRSEPSESSREQDISLEFSESADESYDPTGDELQKRALVNKRRTYRFINRAKAQPRSENNLKTRRKEEAQEAISDNTSSWPCCKRLRCFRNADSTVLLSKRRKILEAPQLERKRLLREMMNEDGKFFFNRKQVCTFFMLNAFGYSKDLQRSVRGTAKAPSTGMISRTPKVKVASQQREVIESYLKDLAEVVGDKMPDANETHLPFPQKKHVYELLLDTFEAEFPSGLKPPCFSYFVSVWNERLKWIKVRKLKRFTKCTDCEMNRDALIRWSHDVKKCQAILEEQRRHMLLISSERAAYTSRARRPLREPTSVCRIVIDGADQTSFGLPHFVQSVKAARGEGLDVKLVGLLEHRPMPLLHLYTMTAQFETGANHIIETLHRWINLKVRALQLPPILLLQLDNCTRENKNRYIFSYLECLVSWGVFVEIEVSFLPIGHTHCDIDQKFSCTSAKLRSNNAATLNELHALLRDSYTPRPKVTSIKQVANISSLFEQEKSIAKVPNFSHYRFFKFSRSTGNRRSGTASFSTSCAVKVNCDENWEPLFKSSADRGFLLKTPDLGKTPSYVLKKPKNERAILERIESEEVRIGSPAKVQELFCLVREVYGGGRHSFQWDMENCIESIGMRGKLKRYHDKDESDIDLTSYIPLSNIQYKLNSFVAVAPEKPTMHFPFWIGKIEKLISNKHGDTAGLLLRWYETTRGQNAFEGSYTPSTRDEQRRSGTVKVPWLEELNVDTVFCQIDSLTRANKLGAITVRRLQEIVKYKSLK